jgi:cellulose synthase/poly-beta-1,6-N-acetylglucosamine synthase-like glycosyltransferase
MTAANVKIRDNGSLLSLVQRYEYLVGYRLKKALNVYNMEYIIGGVGSTFRKSVAAEVGGYDTDTMTEDIDFTLKLLRNGNVKQRVAYAPTVIAYTESVLNFRDLVKQRFRWKYGRMQSFLKNRELFFASHKKYDKRLTWYQLPYSLWAELMFLFEPFMIVMVLTTILVLGDVTTLASVYLTTTFFVAWNIWTDESEDRRAKLKLLPLSLLQYPLFFILTAVEYGALIKSLARLHQLKSSLGHGSWEHVARSAR